MHVNRETVRIALVVNSPFPGSFTRTPEVHDFHAASEADSQTRVARAALLRIRALLSDAQERALDGVEVKELQRHCDTIYPGLPRREEFTAHARRFCLSIFGCGILVTGASNGVEELYQDACEMLAILDERVFR